MPIAALALTTLLLSGPPSKPPQNSPSVLLALKPPRNRFLLEAPLPSLSPVQIDSYQNGWGYAQQAARAKGLQGRILWVDATANLDRVNDEAKIKGLVAQIAASGFNTIVFDVKPISGHVLFFSRIAPKLKEWKGKVLPDNFDPLAVFVRECKLANLSLLVSLNAFSEGHRDFLVGPGYEKLDQQSVLYDAQPIVRANGSTCDVDETVNRMPKNEAELGVFNDTSKMPTNAEGLFAVTLDREGRVVDGFERGGNGPGVPTIPARGVALVGNGIGAEFLRKNAQPGALWSFDTRANFLPTSARPELQVPLMMNPHHGDVQRRALDLLKELVGRYEVDGVLYDDRMRFAGPNADFSPQAQAGFEKWVGRKLNWPDDVYRAVYTPSFVKGIRPGPFYDAWLVWRAQTLRNFIALARQAVKETRPACLFGIYAGSWYGEYTNWGANYAASEYEAGFWFLTPTYQKTGFAGQLDILITGCYYPTATIYDAMQTGVPIGVTVEAAGSLTNRLVRDRAWSYAGISLSQFKGNPKGLENVLQAACAATQGVMVFDLSHDIAPFWEVFRNAFAKPAPAPHRSPDVLHDARKKRLAVELRGTKERPPIIVAGASGIGH